jgi:glycerol-3-phosphate dehydrogenase subunit B
LHHILVKAIEKNGGQVFDGMMAIAADAEEGHIKTVWTEAAARNNPHYARTYILATGGILGGGIQIDHNGYAHDMVFDLPLAGPVPNPGGFDDQFLSPSGHPIYRTGLKVNREYRPIGEDGQVLYDNLFITGCALGSSDPIREGSLEGVALATGYCVGEQITRI